MGIIFIMTGVDVLNAGLLAGTIHFIETKGKNNIYRITTDKRRFYLYDLKVLLLSELSSKAKFSEFIHRARYLSLTTPNRDIAEVAAELNWDVFTLIFAERGKVTHEYIDISIAKHNIVKLAEFRSWLWKNSLDHTLIPLINKVVIRFTDPRTCAILVKRLEKTLKKGMFQSIKRKSDSIAVIASVEVRHALMETAKEQLGDTYFIKEFNLADSYTFIESIYLKKKICIFGSPTWRFMTMARDFGLRLVVFDSRVSPIDADLVQPYADIASYKELFIKYISKICKGRK